MDFQKTYEQRGVVGYGWHFFKKNKIIVLNLSFAKLKLSYLAETESSLNFVKYERTFRHNDFHTCFPR